MPTGAQSAARHVRSRGLISSSSSSPSSLLVTTTTIVVLLFSSTTLIHAQENDAAQCLLKFKSSLANAESPLADWNPSKPPCPQKGNNGNWNGVLCYNSYVFGLQLENMNLKGQIDVDALVPLRYLRALSFMNNSFEGEMPDWRKLGALKSLYVSDNQFSGQIAEDAFRGMASMKKVHLANNKFSGHIPASIESPKLIELRLENNQFSGTIPPLSSEFLKVLNVSNNQLEGPIPDTLSNLDPSSFAGNKALCGKPLGSDCNPPIPPPDAEPSLHPPSPPTFPTSEITADKKMSTTTIALIVVGILLGLFLLILIILLLYRRNCKKPPPPESSSTISPLEIERNAAIAGTFNQSETTTTMAIPPVKKIEQQQQQQPGKLSFVRDDRQKFDLQDLMRASAEVLGSGNFGASYKAVLVDGEALVVKRFKQMNSVAKEDFHEHMRRIGRLKHPNLLPLVAYLYRKEEKLLVFDYVYHGSLAARLHGKHSAEQPSLSWPRRLKIIKGVAKGLSFLQNELPNLTVPHCHLKSSNVLLDREYNPLLMDYALVPVVNPNQVHHILVGYKSPEYAQQGTTTKKTDVWCLGILILETLTGRFVAKYLSQGSPSYGAELDGWIKDIARDASSGDNEVVFDREMSVENSCVPQIEKLLWIGISCCEENPDQRLDLKEVVRQIEQIQEY